MTKAFNQTSGITNQINKITSKLKPNRTKQNKHIQSNQQNLMKLYTRIKKKNRYLSRITALIPKK